MAREERNDPGAGIDEPDDPERQKIRLESEVLRLQTLAIGAGMRRDRHWLVLDVVEWVVIAAAGRRPLSEGEEVGSVAEAG